MINLFGLRLPLWLVGLALYVLWVGLGWSLMKAAFAWLRMLTSKTETKLDDALIAAANFPITLMIFVWGAALIVHFVVPGLPAAWSRVIGTASKIATLAAAVLFVDFLLHNLLDIYAEKIIVLRASHAFASAIIHVIVITTGVLMMLDSLGVSITPIIASLGIGSLAVALALQPTFENIFSGFQILIDQPVSPGHYIKLESGEEGFVEKIGWRTSWLRQTQNNTVIIPNKQMVNARIINYNYPSKDMPVTVEVGVHYNSDLDKVERATVEVGREIMKTVTGGVPDFVPMVRFQSFSASSINFLVILKVMEVIDAALVRHEFIKALSKRFAKEGIVIPYPVTALNTAQEKAAIPI